MTAEMRLLQEWLELELLRENSLTTEPICQWIKYQQRQSTFFTDADGKALSLLLKHYSQETE